MKFHPKPQNTRYVLFTAGDPLKTIIVYKRRQFYIEKADEFIGFCPLFPSGKQVDTCNLQMAEGELARVEIDANNGERLVGFTALFEYSVGDIDEFDGLSRLFDISVCFIYLPCISFS